ncbi:MAG TPA: peptidoglycan DD-metalloendopeptidase family protein [Jiangellales bacterium]|nr:peptidoglycan DD-metalloendopeptidase family protein [Jiangellales bacterium]
MTALALSLVLALVPTGTLVTANGQDAEGGSSVQELSRELAAAAERLEQARASADAAGQEVGAVQAQLAETRVQQEVTAQRLKAAQLQESKARAELGRVSTRISGTQESLGAIARQAYQEGGMAEWTPLLDADSAQDFTDDTMLVNSAMRSQGYVLGELSEAKAEITATTTTLEAKREEAAALAEQAEAEVQRVAELEAAAVAARQEAQATLDEATDAQQALERELAAEREREAAREAEAARVAAELAARQKDAEQTVSRGTARTEVQASGGALLRPVGGPVTSVYGMRRHPITGVVKLHDGTDFGSPCGTPIRAAAAGTVVEAGWANGYGNFTVIDHGVVDGRSLSTAYAHQSRFAARAGARVAAGEVLGYVGSTGYSTGCHLHFMVYVGGSTTNPMGWL